MIPSIHWSSGFGFGVGVEDATLLILGWWLLGETEEELLPRLERLVGRFDLYVCMYDVYVHQVQSS